MNEVTLEALIERVRELMHEALADFGANISGDPNVKLPLDPEGASLLLWVNLLPATETQEFDVAVNAIIVGGRYDESVHKGWAPNDAFKAWYNGSTPAVIGGSLEALGEMFGHESAVIDLLQRAANRAKRQAVAA